MLPGKQVAGAATSINADRLDNCTQEMRAETYR